jgi:hypothetical protein
VSERRLGCAWLSEVDPPDLSSSNQRRPRFDLRTISLVRLRNAAGPGSSPGCPPRAMARFHASVGSAPVFCRNSRAACARRPLRESLSALALASTWRNSSSGREMAVLVATVLLVILTRPGPRRQALDRLRRRCSRRNRSEPSRETRP